jgi:hypothetical protein
MSNKNLDFDQKSRFSKSMSRGGFMEGTLVILIIS